MNPSSFLSLGVALALTLGACGPGENDDATGGTGSGGASGSTVGSGSQSSAGGAGGTPQETGSASSSGASGGATSTGGAGTSGSTSSGGGSGAATSGATGAGGAPGGACTRELLDGLLDDYFAALAAGDPSSLPLADGVKFTENGKQAEIGTTDFWRGAGEVKHSQRALDTEACSAGAQAVIPEGGRDLPVALRIKVEGSELTEIETIVVRPGDYTASFSVASNPAAIIAIADEIGWHDEVPVAERATREELTSWIDKYFRAFPSGVCNVTGACKRLENGGGNFACGAAASCSAADPGSGGTFVPRVILADEVRGIAIGLTIFDFMTDGHLDMHMIKMSGGKVHAVHAILRDTNGVSGWE
ncbi:hypothetical protein WME79_41205 [Sorangium sp. So ce726]|uniref:hypothetical protein n=1 Tax=Sorangium sp. So ce726 TaxID=3133319 RepID=UPI003F600162